MRSLLLIMVLMGCAAEADDPGPIHVEQMEELPNTRASEMADTDVCSLAAELPADDICSLICDPTAMAAQLVADGSDRGACYQLYCGLPDGDHVLVGVCLPP